MIIWHNAELRFVRRSPVEHVQVQAGEHAFPRSSCRKRATTTHHHVEHRKWDEVVLL